MHKKSIYEKKRILFIKKKKKNVLFFLKNRFLILVNKERGTSVYPVKEEEDTLINFMYMVNFDLPRFGLVNRLDRYSSGIVIFCRKKKVFKKFLVEQKRKKITKYYLALVKGFLDFDKKKITCFLNGKKGCLYSFKKKKEYRYSKTIFFCVDKVYLNGSFYSLFKCVTKTGRYHQIRKHLKILKLVLYNDRLYDKREEKGDFFLNLYGLNYKKKKITTDFRFFLLKFYFNFNFKKKVVLK